jgi:hypothetical protein
VKGIPLLLRHRVGVFVLLNINLYVGKRFWMYFVDFVAVILVSWRAISAGSPFGCFIRSCKFGKEVVKAATFHVIIWVVKFVWGWIGRSCGAGLNSEHKVDKLTFAKEHQHCIVFN